MGHTICNTSQPLPQPSFNSTESLIYTGLDWWEPNQWNEMIELMGLTLSNHSKVGTWNELVLNVTTDDDYTSAIQAVFYVKTGNIKDDWIARRIAIREAKKLGNNKPLLYVDQQQSNLSSKNDDDDIDLFHCDNDYQPSYLRQKSTIVVT